ncbi:TPT-domain-containing protein [Pluteus cervinus]|uniref:TPT-domain-containing protein n=1 Tax=Pluteus cervinus TaxID=181527 RepID=A0ACD3B9M5_9AGAR|nr:TPT-domain-containing protein [Pluteus cervinus]
MDTHREDNNSDPARDALLDEERTLYDEPSTHLASVEEKKRLWWKNAVINTFFISCWFTFATILSLYNKWMFAPEHLGFPFPLFVTTIHMFIQFLLAALLRLIWPRKFKPEHNPTRQAYAKKALPAAISTSLDIGFSNLSLKIITLSFYTMCKSSSLIFVLSFAFLFRLEKFSWRLIGVIFLIFSGVLLMVATETHFVLPGFILVLSASALSGFRWSLTQILLKDKKMGLDNPAATVYWLSPAMGVTLAIISVFVDGWITVARSPFFNGLPKTLETLFYLICPGFLAFSMVMSEFYIIQRTGVVPMSIAGIAKEVTTISIAAWYFHDELTPLNITGVGITICGIALFTYHKYRKSIDSTVPLDAHGNPIVVDDEDDRRDLRSYGIELEETMRLTEQNQADYDERATLLFSAGGDDDAEELHSIRSSKVMWDSETPHNVTSEEWRNEAEDSEEEGSDSSEPRS